MAVFVGARFEREKFAHVFAQQLWKSLVQIGADGNVAFVARIVLRKFADHACLFVELIAFELHRAWLQGTVAGNHEPTQAGFARRRAASVKILPCRFQCRNVGGDPVGAVHALFELFQSPVQRGPLGIGIQEVVATAGTPGGIGAVINVDAPFCSLVRDPVDLFDILGRNAVVQNNIVVTERRDLRHDLAQMLVQSRKSAEIVVPFVGEIQADAILVDSGIAQLEVAVFGHVRPVRYQDDKGKS